MTNEELAMRAQQGDERAKAALVEQNAGLVYQQVRRMQVTPEMHLDAEDLYLEGVIGMLRAIELFDPAKGKFTTYATWWIRQAMRRAVEMQERTIRLPVHVLDRLRRVPMEQWPPVALSPVSLDAPLPAGPEGSRERLLDFITESEQPAENRRIDNNHWGELYDRIEAAMDRLPAAEREILRLRFGLDQGSPRTFLELGAHYGGVTRQRAEQRVKRALRRLQQLLSDERHTDDGANGPDPDVRAAGSGSALARG